jgi:hypothetical protein
MRIDIGSICRKLAPLAALAMAGGLSACGTSINIDGEEGKKLAELDMSGEAPTKLVMAGPDHVKVSEGAKLAITVDGDPKVAEHLRFTLKNGTLGILRAKSWKDGGAVTINVTMPAPQDVTLAGSGTIDANALGKDANVTVAGSGDVNAGTLSGDSLKLTLAGSGSMKGGGAVKNLDMTIAGAGSANLSALRADRVKVTVAGSGNALLMSDGEVSATIMGSGMVNVRGRATCKVSSMGSGKLVCESGPAQTSDAPVADDSATADEK